MYEIIISVIAVICFLGCTLLVYKGGYFNKVLVKLGIKENKPSTNWAVFSWDSCLKKLGVKADVVFFGDSIIRGGDFHKAFPDKKVINLGMSGDTLSGMENRVDMVKAVSPEKIFFLGGINGLTDFNGKRCAETYEKLIEKLKAELPEAKIYIHSLLPLSAEKEKSICHNKAIEAFNAQIKSLAEKYGLGFVDLYPLYLVDAHLDPKLTKDGIHLLPEGYEPWYQAIEQYMV